MLDEFRVQHLVSSQSPEIDRRLGLKHEIVHCISLYPVGPSHRVGQDEPGPRGLRGLGRGRPLLRHPRPHGVDAGA